MTIHFPSLPGGVERAFEADLDGTGVHRIEIWETETSIPTILRWQVHDEPTLYSEAVADRAILFPRAEAFPDQIVNQIRFADHEVSVEEILDEAVILKLEDPVRFWERFHPLRESLKSAAEIEPDFILRVSPQDQPQGLGGAAEDELSWIGAREVWPTGMDNSDALVAVIDTGLDLTHPSLEHHLARDPSGTLIGCNLVQNGFPPLDDHWQSHGTFCAGLVAGAAVGDFRGGVLREGRIVPVKTFDSDGLAPATRIAKAIRFAASAHVQAICASWSNLSYSSLLRRRIRQAGNEGCLFVTAAGNYGIDLDVQPTYPASFRLPNILVIGGLSDALEPMSGWGRGKATVHLSAPGESILSLERQDYDPLDPFQELSGTSAASAIVAGAAALVQGAALHELGHLLSPLELKRILIHSTEPLDPQFSQVSCSCGYVNLRNAVDMVAGKFAPVNPPSCP